MIFQALCDYYQCKASDPGSGIAPEGFEKKEIPFVLVIDEDGLLNAIEDTREYEGKKKKTRSFIVPQQQEKRNMGIKPNLLWDNIEYALGANPRQRDNVVARHLCFKDKIRQELAGMVDTPAIKALLLFLEKQPIAQIESRAEYAEVWQEMQKSNASLTFRLHGSSDSTICDTVHPYLMNKPPGRPDGYCLVTGKPAKIARLHAPIKGVRNATPSGAIMVSFNSEAFCSYGKEQNYNAPVGASAAFAYTTALNLLLDKESQNKFCIGNVTVVFWAQMNKPKYNLEQDFPCFFTDITKGSSDQGTQAVRNLYQAVLPGNFSEEGPDWFYVLGLSPNAARIAIRFWKNGTVSDFATNIKQHFDDLEIVKGPKNHDYLNLNHLLQAIAPEHNMDKVSSALSCSIINSMLDGSPYPITLLQQCIRRIRAEQCVTRTHAAILKACINRHNRIHNFNAKEFTVSLDKSNQYTGYRLGRLFAVLEKIQDEANPGTSATIRERFYSTASTSPMTVFPKMLKIKNYHLAKLDKPGRIINLERVLGEIFDGIPEFPPHLTMDEQAHFAIGYYHQRQDFFESNTKKIANDNELNKIKGL